MRYKFIPLLFTFWLSVSLTTAAMQDCPALVQKALSRTENACAGMRGNQACYGYQTLEAQLQEGLSPFAFNGVGDITGVETIQSLHMSAMNPVTDEWGVTVMRVRADISEDYPDANVTLLAFGDVSLDAAQDGQQMPMQAFALHTGDSDSGCADITENGLLIQTPEGVGRITLWINDVHVRIGSTVLFQAQPGGDLTISTFAGLAQVEAQGQMQEAPAGMRVRVPLDDAMQPAAPPTLPEAFDAEATGLASLVLTVTAFTDGSVSQLFGAGDGSGDGTGTGGQGDGASDRNGDCNRDHGQGAANGNCFGHANGNNGNGGGNGN